MPAICWLQSRAWPAPTKPKAFQSWEYRYKKSELYRVVMLLSLVRDDSMVGTEDMTNDPLHWLKGLPWYTLGLVLLLRIGVAEANFVPTGSMQPTIGVIDVLVVNKTAFGLKLPLTDDLLLQWGTPEHGDIVTFDPSHTDDTLIKRVIGLPGDEIEIRGGFLFLNGQRLGHLQRDGLIAEKLNGHRYLTRRARPRDFMPVTVPAGHLFVMGRNPK